MRGLDANYRIRPIGLQGGKKAVFLAGGVVSDCGYAVQGARSPPTEVEVDSHSPIACESSRQIDRFPLAQGESHYEILFLPSLA